MDSHAMPTIYATDQGILHLRESHYRLQDYIVAGSNKWKLMR